MSLAHAATGWTDDTQYNANDCWEACWRVLWRNDARAHSASLVDRYSLSKTGHWERANAYTHLCACVAMLVYASVRTRVGVAPSDLDVQWHIASLYAAAFTFGASVAYHVLGTIRCLVLWVRWLDFASIYALIAVDNLATIAVATGPTTHADARTWCDPIVAAVAAGGFFAWHACIAPNTIVHCEYGAVQAADARQRAAKRGLTWQSGCDGAHAPVRAATSLVLLVQWTLTVPLVWHTFGNGTAALWIVVRSVGSVGIVLGMQFADHEPIALALLEVVPGRCPLCCACVDLGSHCGCLMLGHAWWHVTAFVVVACNMAVREHMLAVRLR